MKGVIVSKSPTMQGEETIQIPKDLESVSCEAERAGALYYWSRFMNRVS